MYMGNKAKVIFCDVPVFLLVINFKVNVSRKAAKLAKLAKFFLNLFLCVLCFLCGFARNFSFSFNKKLLYRQTLISGFI